VGPKRKEWKTKKRTCLKSVKGKRPGKLRYRNSKDGDIYYYEATVVQEIYKENRRNMGTPQERCSQKKANFDHR